MNTEQIRRRKIRVDVISIIALIVSVVAIVVTLLSSLGAAAMQNRHGDKNILGGATVSLTFGASQDRVKNVNATIEPARGNLYCSLRQDSGNTPTVYTVKYKKTTSGSYTALRTWSMQSNGTFTSQAFMANADGYTDYNTLLTKMSNVTLQSKVSFDWVLAN